MKATFFVNSIVGYVGNSAALYTRALAHGLSLRGHDIRVVETRQNEHLARTLREIGSEASRHVYESFSSFQYTTFEPRTGARLLEWVTREVALIDVAVAVGGVDDEICRWLANVTRENLTRAYLEWVPDALTSERAEFLELEKYDLILAPDDPATSILWSTVPRTIASQDLGLATHGHADRLTTDTPDPLHAAQQFETVVERRHVV